MIDKYKTPIYADKINVKNTFEETLITLHNREKNITKGI